MQILTIIVPYSKSTSNLSLTCSTLRTWLSNNGFPVKTSKSGLSLQSLDYYLSLSPARDTVFIWAAMNGDLSLLKLIQKRGYMRSYKRQHLAEAARQAAEGGHFKCLKWLIKHGEPLHASICEHAAKGGHLEILKWLRERGCAWNWRVCSYAAEGGHLEVLRWARENGCDWNDWTCCGAAKGGHLEVLKWVIENGCDWDSNAYVYASRNGQSEILKWMWENGAPREWFKDS